MEGKVSRRLVFKGEIGRGRKFCNPQVKGKNRLEKKGEIKEGFS